MAIVQTITSHPTDALSSNVESGALGVLAPFKRKTPVEIAVIEH